MLNAIHIIKYSVFSESLHRWLTHSRIRHRLVKAAPSIRSGSILKCVVSLRIRLLLFMLLVVAGDVERNPGPLRKEGTACVYFIHTNLIFMQA